MDKKKIVKLAVGAVVVALAVGTGAGFFLGHNEPLQPTVIKPIPQDKVADPSIWGENYPAQYASFLKNDTDKGPKVSHFVDMPYLKTMYKGTGYAEEFNHPRGHAYMVEDLRAINPKRWQAKQAACNTCKSSQIPGLIEKYGDSYYSMDFHKINDQLEFTVACANCHDPKTMELVITQKPLIEAFARQGIDVNKASRQEKRSLVCAQCHVSYYFAKEPKNKVTFPWDEGLSAKDHLAYYDKINFTEWTHPDTGTPLVKPRHADYELFKGSIHESAGVSCADCHMPYMKEGNQKISSHHVGSPLDNIEQSCRACHRESADWLKDRVHKIQSNTKMQMDRGGQVVEETIANLKVAKDLPNVDKKMLEEAQRLHRLGQYYLDYQMVTNGLGFHNPEQTQIDLANGIDYCLQATSIAREAIVKAGGTLPERKAIFDVTEAKVKVEDKK